MNEALAKPPQSGSVRASGLGPTILLFNVKYSPNLGDGLLAECLEREICAQWPQARVESVDMAGRSAYRPGRTVRASMLAGLNACPGVVRQSVVRVVLGAQLRRRLIPLWRERLADADAVVLGGGNLLSDADLNFPLKIDAALGEARAFGLPIGVFAIGVADNWSAHGGRLFRRALGGKPPFHASVRDEKSAAVWRRRLAGAVAPPEVVCDPGLLASAHFAAAPRASGGPSAVGLGVMHPASLRYHADERLVSPARQREWLLRLAARCLAEGWELRLFTNGSPEDEAYLRQVAPALRTLPCGERASVAPRFETPADLARFISGLDLMFAHRLHANILAYSYAVPQVGFTWDSKLQSFANAVGRGEFMATMGVDPVEETAKLGARTLREGVDSVAHRRVLAGARADVGRLVAALRAAAPGPARPVAALRREAIA